MGKPIPMTSTAIGRGLLELTPEAAELCTTTSETEEVPLKQDINKKSGRGDFPRAHYLNFTIL